MSATQSSDIPTPEVSDVPSLPDGWHVLNFNVISGGGLAISCADADIRKAYLTDRTLETSGEYARLSARATARIWTFDWDILLEAIEYPLLGCHPAFIDEFQDGRWLVAGNPSSDEWSARIFTSDGAELRRIQLGDCVSRIKIDSRQRIWVGWFDQGVFGNGRWRYPGLKWPPSSYGVAAFDDGGTLITHATLDSIADCYALNVTGDAAWACTYTGFPISQIGGDRDRSWSTELRGTSALAVSYPYVLAAGGYKGE